MFKKILFMFFTFSVLLGTTYPNITVEAKEEKMPITSKMYGTQYKGEVTFDTETCFKDYARLHKDIADAKIDDFKFDDKDGLSGLGGKLLNMINESIFHIGQGLSNILFGASCYLGISPSQLLQLMFFPVVLDEYSFLDTMSTVVRTVSILVLLIITVLSILELQKKSEVSDISEEIISKAGLFTISAGLIAFSKFVLQGIFDIANSLGYYVSNYNISVAVSTGDKPTELTTNLLNFPTIFVTYLEFAFSPDILNKIPQFNLMMVGIMTIAKIIVMIFITKDLLRIGIYGLKRMITMISSAVIVPVLAGLIPSYRTQSIFNRYFRNVIATAFSPVLFGLIYLSTAPFIIEDLVGLIEAPLLKVLTLAFFLNILASIPDFVDGLIGSSNTITNKRFETGANRLEFGSMKSFRNEFQGINRTYSTLRQQTGQRPTIGQVTREYTRHKIRSMMFGRK